MSVVDVKTILSTSAFRAQDVEKLLDRSHGSWIRFDPELGYVPADTVMRDGMNYSRTTYRYEKMGQRKMVNYPDRPCRINTYGDSFTQSQQVSDDESWQERIAAHIGEPVRNFGCGGYSTFAAYRRALRMEQTECSAEYVILNVFDDDHVRNLDTARWIRTAWWQRNAPKEKTWQLHGLPWAHLRYDLEKDGFVEIEGLCKTEDDLRALADPDTFYNTFKDDQITRLFTIQNGGEAECKDLELLAEVFGLKVDLRSEKTRAADAHRLHQTYGFKSNDYILDKFRPWLAERGKKLMVVTSYSIPGLKTFLEDKPRIDQPLVDYVKKNNVLFVDALVKHKQEFDQFKLSSEEYVYRYYIQAAGAAVFGHYTPMGNMFYAQSILQEVIDWLDPKPQAYSE